MDDWSTLPDAPPSAPAGDDVWSSLPDHPVVESGFQPITFNNTDDYLNVIRQLENSGPTARSPRGALGTYQIMPTSAARLGFTDVKRLRNDPDYNRAAAAAYIQDVQRQYGTKDIYSTAVLYNSSPRYYNRWIKSGRDRSVLLPETQKYLNHLDNILGAGNNLWASLPDRAPGFAKGGSVWDDLPDTPSQTSDWDNLPDTPSEQPEAKPTKYGKPTSVPMTILHHAGEEVLPTAGGLAAVGPGATAGAELGAFAGPWGAGAGGLLGGLGGYLLGSTAIQKAQDWAIHQLPESAQSFLGQDTATRQAEEQQHPYASMAGSFLPQLAAMRPSAVLNLGQRLLGAGISGITEGYNEFTNGQGLDPGKLAIAAGAGALMDKPTRIGRALGLHDVAPSEETIPPQTRQERFKPAEKLGDMPDVGSKVGMQMDNGDTMPVTVTNYLTDKDGTHHTAIELPNGNGAFMPTDKFMQRLTAAPGGDVIPADEPVMPGRPLTQTEAESLGTEGLQSRVVPKVKPEVPDESNYPPGTSTSEVRQDVKFGHRVQPEPESTLPQVIRGMGKIQLIGNDGTPNQYAGEFLDLFKDKLTAGQRTILSKLAQIDPIQRVIRGAQMLSDNFATKQMFAVPGKGGLNPDAMREALSQPGVGWLRDTENRGDSIGDLYDKLWRVQNGEQVVHPDSTYQGTLSRWNDIQRELTEAGVKATDSDATAIQKLQKYRLENPAPEPIPVEEEPPERENIAAEASRRPAEENMEFSHDVSDDWMKWINQNPLQEHTPQSTLEHISKFLQNWGNTNQTEAGVVVSLAKRAIRAIQSSDNRNYILFPDNILMSLKANAADQNILLHNHPSKNNPLSPGDIGFMVQNNFHAITAHDASGHHYIATQGPKVAEGIDFYTGKGAPADLARDQVAHDTVDLYNRLTYGAIDFLQRGAGPGETKPILPARVTETLAYHASAALMHDMGLIDYHTTWKPPAQYADIFKSIIDNFKQEVAYDQPAGRDSLNQSAIGGLTEGLDRILGRPSEVATDQAGAGQYPAGAAPDRGATERERIAPHASGLEEPELTGRYNPEEVEAQRATDQPPNLDRESQLTERLSQAHPDDNGKINRTSGDMAKTARGRSFPQLNAVKALFTFPRTLATLHKQFGEYYKNLLNREGEFNSRLQAAREMVPTFLKLPMEAQQRIYAAAEYLRMNKSSVADDGSPINVFNNKFDHLRGLTNGDGVELTTPDEIKGYHELQGMFKAQFDGKEEAWVRRLVGDQTFAKLGWSDDPAKNMASLQNVFNAAQTASERKALTRAITGFQTMEQARRPTYLPLRRYGDYHISVVEKPTEVGEEREGGDTYKTRWFQMVQQPAWDAFKTAIGPTNRDIKVKLDAHGNPLPPDWAKAAVDDARRRFPDESRYEIKHGWNVDREATDEISIPALDKLMTQSQRTVIKDLMARGRTRDEAMMEFQRTQGAAYDALMDRLVEINKAEFNRESNDTPGYSGDFARATGDYLYHSSRHISAVLHNEKIEEALNAIRALPANQQGIKDFAEWHNKYMENELGGSRSLNAMVTALQKAGFAYTMAGNPSTMAMFEFHTPQLSVPRMSLGIGFSNVFKQLGPAFLKAHSAIKFDLTNGLTIDLNRFIKNLAPDEREAVLYAAKSGIFGADFGRYLDAMPETESEPLGQRPEATAGQTFARQAKTVDRIAASTIGVIDRANRMSTFLAAYRVAKNPNLGTDMGLFWSHPTKGSELWRATREGTEEGRLADLYHRAREQYEDAPNATAKASARKDMIQARQNYLDHGVNPQAMAEFMVKEAGGDYGRINTPQIASTPAGRMVYFLHGFTTRYLSSTMRMLWQHGPEGRSAVLKLLPFALSVVGAEGLPFTQDAENLYDWLTKKLTGRDPMTSYRLRGLLANNLGLGKKGAEAVMRGPLGELLGIDLTGRIGLGDFISRELGSTQGTGVAAYDVLGSHITNAVSRIRTGQGWQSALAELTPNDVRNLYRAWSQSQHGVRSPGAKRPSMPARKVTFSDSMKTMLGFRPLDQEEAFQFNDWLYRMKANARAHKSSPQNPIPTP